MNWSHMEANWRQLRGKIREHWGKLTDDELDVIAGRYDQLAGKVQERYGTTTEEAAKQLNAFARTCSLEERSRAQRKA